MDLITVIMSVYKEPLIWVKQSTLSILDQTYFNIELIIIIDNPELDESIRIYLESLGDSDSRVKIIENKKNIGLVKSLNIGLSLSNGKYFARMDADDISVSDRIEKELNYLKDNDLDLVGSTVIDIDETGKPLHGVTGFPEKHDNLAKYLKYDSCVIHPTWLAKKSLFDALNGYREIEACEDYDFLTRAVVSGYRLGVIQEPLLYYRINSNGISSTKKTIQKVSLDLLRQQYRNNKILSIADFEAAKNSDEGEILSKQYGEYYANTSDLKTKHGFPFLFDGIKLVILSPIAKKRIMAMIVESFLKRF